jgi:hypothetical protein
MHPNPLLKPKYGQLSFRASKVLTVYSGTSDPKSTHVLKVLTKQFS